MLLWLLVFLMGVTLIFGYVHLYELNLQIETMEQQLTEKQLTLGDLRKERQQLLKQLDTYAEDWNMYKPEPEEYIVIHVQGTNH